MPIHIDQHVEVKTVENGIAVGEEFDGIALPCSEVAVEIQ
jgi:hypothetical protein